MKKMRKTRESNYTLLYIYLERTWMKNKLLASKTNLSGALAAHKIVQTIKIKWMIKQLSVESVIANIVIQFQWLATNKSR